MVREEAGRDKCPACQVNFRGAAGTRPSDLGWHQPDGTNKNLDSPRNTFPAFSLFKPQPQLTTDGYVEDFHEEHREAGTQVFPVSQFRH